MHILTSAQVKQLENGIVNEQRQHIKLMETAGGSVAKFIHDKFGSMGRSVAVVCGRGNNGGDGFVAAQKLFEGGASVRILLADGMPTADDAYDLLGRSERAGIKVLSWQEEDQREEFAWCIDKAGIIVDAVFGVGFHGEPDEEMSEIFKLINLSKAEVVAIDVPSGVIADTGEVCENAVVAEYTVTFTAMKPAHVIYPGAEFCGTVFTAPIGIGEEDILAVEPTLNTIDYQSIRLCFDVRKHNTYKGSYGTLLEVCGSYGMAGAAVLAGKAAAQSGVGLVRMVVPGRIYPIVAGHLIDPVFVPLKTADSGTLRGSDADEIAAQLEGCTAALIGCGLGKGEDVKAIVRKLIETSEIPLVLDADALNAVAEDIDVLHHAKAPIIITPHPGEMAHLMRMEPGEVQSNRLNIATDFAQEFGVYVVLKGANTICAMPDGRTYVNLTGNPGMSKGGSGDVLAGIIASFLAQGMSPSDAAQCGVYIHGAAGDHAARQFSQRAMTPMDIIFEMATVFSEIER